MIFVLGSSSSSHSIFFSATGFRKPCSCRYTICSCTSEQNTSSFAEICRFSRVLSCCRRQAMFRWICMFCSLLTHLLVSLLMNPTTPVRRKTKLCGNSLSSGVIVFLQPLHFDIRHVAIVTIGGLSILFFRIVLNLQSATFIAIASCSSNLSVLSSFFFFAVAVLRPTAFFLTGAALFGAQCLLVP